MKSTELALRPSYWASVSGGKDSLFMLNIICGDSLKIQEQWIKDNETRR